jgi:hypothetical protein
LSQRFCARAAMATRAIRIRMVFNGAAERWP